MDRSRSEAAGGRHQEMRGRADRGEGLGSAVIVIGVSATVFIIFMALGVLAYVFDGAQALGRRRRRKERAASLYSASPNRAEERH